MKRNPISLADGGCVSGKEFCFTEQDKSSKNILK